MICPYCGNGGIYVHCCPNYGRALRQPCKACPTTTQTDDPDCDCYTGSHAPKLTPEANT